MLFRSIPTDALEEENGQNYVYLLQENVLTRTNIEIGKRTLNYVEVIDGIIEGAKISRKVTGTPVNKNDISVATKEAFEDTVNLEVATKYYPNTKEEWNSYENATIEEIYVNVDQVVKKGDPILKIIRNGSKARLEECEEEKNNLIKTYYKKREVIKKENNNIAKYELELLELQYNYDLKQINKRIQQAQEEIGELIFYAPFKGKITTIISSDMIGKRMKLNGRLYSIIDEKESIIKVIDENSALHNNGQIIINNVAQDSVKSNVLIANRNITSVMSKDRKSVV